MDDCGFEHAQSKLRGKKLNPNFIPIKAMMKAPLNELLDFKNL